jgi:hypothetical protein
MGLSDWDAAAWDAKGQPCAASWATADGKAIGIRKAYVWVEDPSAWSCGGNWREPVVLCANRDEPGLHEAGGFRFLVAQGSQRSIFLLAARGTGTDVELFGTIGCSGYVDTFDPVIEVCRKMGLAPVRPRRWMHGSGHSRERDARHATVHGPYGELEWWVGGLDDEMPVNYEYLGVMASTVDAYRDWVGGLGDGMLCLPGGTIAAWHAAISSLPAKRYN